MFSKLLPLHLIIILFYSLSCQSQTIYLASPLDSLIGGTHVFIGSKIVSFDTTDCSIKELCSIRKAGFSDITFHPNGLLYGLSQESVFTSKGLFEYDISTCSILRIIDLPFQLTGGIVSLSNGDIYIWAVPVISAGFISKLYKFRPETNVITYIGDFQPNLGCTSLTVANGKVYSVGYDFNLNLNILVEVNISKPSDSVILFTQEFDLNNDAYGSYSLLSLPGECGLDFTFSQGFNSNNLWAIDLNNGTSTIKCTPEFTSLGATSPLEFLASDPECDLLFDLDRDNSSGVFPYDYRNDGILCSDDRTTHIVDTDVFLHTSADLDSIVIKLEGDVDGSSEAISMSGNIPGASLVFIGDKYVLTLSGDRSDAAWRTVLSALIYTNQSVSPTLGLRTITFTAYNVIKSNQAQTFIRLAQKRYAGKDSTLVICAPHHIDDVSQHIGGQDGGLWFPPFAMTNQYHSDIDLATTYRYITHSECGRDTATLTIQRQPLRSLDLGPNPSLCRAESFPIAVPTITGDQVHWNDGNTSANRILSTPGTYTVSITTADGCIIADSITILRSYDKVRKNQSIPLCEGDIYTYHGQIYHAGDVITDSILASTGCDTLLSITLTTLPTPTVTRDTFTCDNTPLIIHNKTYQIGDTIIMTKASPTACDTLVSTIYRRYESSVSGVDLLDSIVCDGKKIQVFIRNSFMRNFKWSNGEETLIGHFGPGQHYLQATDGQGCNRMFPFEIKAYPAIQYKILTTDATCGQDNGSINIINELPNIAIVSTINGIIRDKASDLPPGKYEILLTESHQCETMDSTTIADQNELTVDMISEINSEIGKIISIAYQTSSGTIDTITFSPTSDIHWVSDSIQVHVTGDQVFSITFIDEFGCMATKTLIVNVDIPTSTLVLPNVVASHPSATDNSLFYLKAVGLTYDMSIYDRWGNLIFDAHDIDGGDATRAWNPSQSNVVSGVYVYLLTMYINGKKIQRYGTVTVL